MTDTLFPELAATAKRPRESDRAVMEAAAAAFAAIVARERPDFLDGAGEDEFREDLLHCLPLIDDDDGMELAQALSRNRSYPLDADAVELMGRWSQENRHCHEDAVRAWVRSAGPSAPFGEMARVRVKDRGPKPLGEGTAYREDRYDQLAQCLVVTDGERDRHVRDGAFAGGYIIAWEDIEVIGEPTEADREAHVARIAHAARMDRERAYQAHARGIDKAFALKESKVEAEIATMGNEDLATYLSSVLQSLDLDVSQPGFDPFSYAMARVSAAMRKVQKRGLRRAFEATEASTAGQVETTP